MAPTVVRCPSCGYVLKARDLQRHECPYCHAALVDPPSTSPVNPFDNLFADLDGDGIPDFAKKLMEDSLGSPPGEGSQSSTVTVTTENGTVVHTSTSRSVSFTSSSTVNVTSKAELPDDVKDLLSKLGVDDDVMTDTEVVSFSKGDWVWVAWSDGNRYAARVVDVAPGKCRVAFQDGRRMWVDNQFLSSFH